MILYALASLALAASSLAPQGEDTALVTYDLRRILPHWDEGSTWNQSLVFAPVLDREVESEWIPGERYTGLQSFELLDLLSQILGDELRREGREMLVEGDGLTVLAPPPLQQQVRAILDGLEQALAGTLSVRVDVLRLAVGASEPTTAALLTEEEAQRLVTSLAGSGAQQRTTTLQLTAGRTAVVDDWRTQTYLGDYDVEIAAGIVAFDPIMTEVRTGVRLALRALALPGGAALSVLQVGATPLGLEVREYEASGTMTQAEAPPITLPGPTLLESPVVAQSGFACDTFLPDGKALVLTLEGALGGSSVREVVVLRRVASSLASYVTRPIPGTNRSLIALDTGLFRPARFTTELDYEDGQRAPGEQPHLRAALDFGASDFLVEWLKARFSIWRPFGPWILIVTDPAWDRDAAQQLERLVKSLRPRTALVEANLELRADGARRVRARLPLLEGTTAALLVARGRTVLADYSVEVAQNAMVHDPSLNSVFEGLALSFLLEGDLAEARGLGQIAGPVETVEPGGAGPRPIERVETRALRFDERLRLQDGRPARFGQGSERGESGLVLELTRTPLR